MKTDLAMALLIAAFTSGCIVEAPSAEKGTSKQGRAVVVTKVPPLSVTSGARLDDKLELMGATVTPGRVLPGETFKVSAVFKVLAPVETDYMVFVHVDDADGRTDRINVDHRPAGGAYSTDQWKKDEMVKDEFSVYVPPGMNARRLLLFVGLWDPKTDSRMKVTNPEAVRTDGKDRILLAEIPVGS
jgi:hypothetical protein